MVNSENKHNNLNRVIVFVDGFNLYHSIDEPIRKYKKDHFKRYKWLDIAKLSSIFLTKSDRIEKIYYFTALCTWNAYKRERHKKLLKIYQNNNIEIIKGDFKPRTKLFNHFPDDKKLKYIKICYKTFEEKQTDVNIAIWLYKLAKDNKYDTAMLITGDTDLVPALKMVRSDFPNKQIGVIIPSGRKADRLERICTDERKHKIKEMHLRDCVMPENVTLSNGVVISCPHEWK